MGRIGKLTTRLHALILVKLTKFTSTGRFSTSWCKSCQAALAFSAVLPISILRGTSAFKLTTPFSCQIWCSSSAIRRVSTSSSSTSYSSQESKTIIISISFPRICPTTPLETHCSLTTISNLTLTGNASGSGISSIKICCKPTNDYNNINIPLISINIKEHDCNLFFLSFIHFYLFILANYYWK